MRHFQRPGGEGHVDPSQSAPARGTSGAEPPSGRRTVSIHLRLCHRLPAIAGHLWLAVALLLGALAFLGVPFALADEPETPGAVIDVGGGTRGKTTQGVQAGDPIWANSGAYGFARSILRVPGPLPLDWTLSYRSDNGFIGGTFVTNNFEHSLFPTLGFLSSGSLAEVEGVRPGELIRFTRSGTVWTLTEPAQVRYELKESASFYYLLDPSAERLYLFEKVGSGTRIRVIQDRNGNRWTYAYTGTSTRPDRLDDGLGRFLTLTYGSSGPANNRLTSATDHGGRTVSFTFVQETFANGTDNVLRSVTDPLTQTTSFAYDFTFPEAVTRITTPLGTVPYRQTYANTMLAGKQGVRVVSQTDAYGNTTSFTYTQAANQVTEIRPDSASVVYQHYGNDGPPAGVADPTGNRATFSRTDRDQTDSVVDRLGATTAITYHLPTGKLAGITNAKGGKLTLTYTAQDQTFTNPITATEAVSFTFYHLTRIGYPDGTSEQLTYDGQGNRLTRVDQRGKMWRSTYDSRGQALTITNPTGGVFTFTYNADGTLATRRDSDTGTTTYGYDTLKRLTQVTHPDGTTAQLAYDANDRLTSVTDERGNTTRYEYDANGNLVRTTDPAGQTTRFTYDLVDRPTGATDRLGKTITSTYDTLGRLARVTDPTGVEVTLGYDPRGWANQLTRGGRTWQTGYSAEGLPVTRTTPSGLSQTTQRDALGFVTGQTDPLGQSSTLTRDALSRLTGAADPLGRTRTYGYDARGELTGVTLPVSGTATYQRDDQDLLGQITDLNGQTWTFTRTVMGRVQAERDPLGRVRQYAYDTRGRPTQITFADGTTESRTYDGTGNLTRRQYSDGTDRRDDFDAPGRITGTVGLQLTRDAEGRVTNSEQAASGFGATYDDAGRLKTATYDNGAFTVTYTYSPTTGLLMRVSDNLSNAAIDFSYDADDRLIRMSRSNGVVASYTWDAAARLTRIQDGSILDLQYSLDAAGQVTGVVMTAPLDPASVFANRAATLGFDAASQVGSTGYSYDARGRLVAGGGHTYTWDGASRLTGVDSTRLGYNGFGQVITRTAGVSTTRYFYNHAIGLAPPVAERDEGSGQVQRHYVWAPDGSLLYAIEVAAGNRPVFYHFDRTGSTLALSDATGTVTDAYAYLPDGRLLGRTGSSTQPFTFVGRLGIRQEGTSGTLFQMRARYYDPETGRFLSQEPLWPQLTNPAELNPYQYALNRPVGVVDVTGTGSREEELGWDFQRRLETAEWMTQSYSHAYSRAYESGRPQAEQDRAWKEFLWWHKQRNALRRELRAFEEREAQAARERAAREEQARREQEEARRQQALADQQRTEAQQQKQQQTEQLLGQGEGARKVAGLVKVPDDVPMEDPGDWSDPFAYLEFPSEE